MNFDFADEEEAMDLYRAYHWGHGVSCTKCDSSNIRVEKVKTSKKRYFCRGCGKKFGDFTGTFLEGKRFLMCEIVYIIENAEKKTRKEIGEDIGWSRQKVSDYIKLLDGSFLEEIFCEDFEEDMDALKKINRKVHLKNKKTLNKYFLGQK